MLELGIALRARHMVFAVSIEAADGTPGTVGSHLTGLGAKGSGKGELRRQGGTVGLQVVSRDGMLLIGIHPFSQAFVADELGGADGFLNGGTLGLCAIEFIGERQHPRLPSCVPRLRCIQASTHRIACQGARRRSGILWSGAHSAQGRFIPCFKVGGFHCPFCKHTTICGVAARRKKTLC
jgi:hypothetical protein